MALSPAQLVTFKAAILAETDAGVVAARAARTDGVIRDFYNAPSSPTFTVWKSLVSIADVGRKINGGELAGLTTLNVTRLQCIATYLAGGISPVLADHRAFFDDIFSGAGGATTRAALLALWKRVASRVERLFATGTGSDASPGTLVFEGAIDVNDVSLALNLP